MAESQTQNRIQKIFANFGLLVLSLIVVITLVELTLRQIWDAPYFRDSYEVTDPLHVARPYVMAVADPSIEGVNSLGYKGPLPPMPKPQNEFRVLIFGGSTVFGHYPPEDSSRGISLVAHTQLRLNEMGISHVKVYNFGITSTVALQEFVRLVVDGVLFEPDLVISYGGGNDYIAPDERVGYPHRFLFYEVNPLLKDDLHSFPTLPLLLAGSAIGRYFIDRQLEDFFYSRIQKTEFKADGILAYQSQAENYKSAIRRMNHYSQSKGAQFIGYFQPLRDFYFGIDSRKLRALDFAQKITDDLKDEMQYEFLFDSLKNEPREVWQDQIHVYDSANIKISQILAEKIAAESQRQ